MRTLIVYESMYGNTHAVAEAIARGFAPAGDVTTIPVSQVPQQDVSSYDLLIVGGPTHVHGMSRESTRRGAVEAAEKPESNLTLEPDAASTGIREWLDGLTVDEGMLPRSILASTSPHSLPDGRRKEFRRSCGIWVSSWLPIRRAFSSIRRTSSSRVRKHGRRNGVRCWRSSPRRTPERCAFSPGAVCACHTTRDRRSQHGAPAAREVGDRPDEIDGDDRRPFSLAAVDLARIAASEIHPSGDGQHHLNDREHRQPAALTICHVTPGFPASSHSFSFPHLCGTPSCG